MKRKLTTRPLHLHPKPVSLLLKTSLLGLGLTHASAQAATLLVTSNADNGSGGCTLREALDSVNAGSPMGGCMDVVPPLNNFGVQDTVLIPGTTFPNDTITLNGSELSVTNPVTVNGFESLVIDGNFQSPVFYVDDAALILNNVTISRGLGGIRGTSSDIRLIQSTISNNSASIANGVRGGGIDIFYGSLTLENSTITNNTASGGGGVSLYQANAMIYESSIDNNQANEAGGLLARTLSSVVIEKSSVTGNTAQSIGGVGAVNSDISVIGSSISNNASTNFYSGAGGISLVELDTSLSLLLSLSNSSVSNNRTLGSGDGGGISLRGNVTLSGNNSSISSNTSNTFDGLGGGIVAFGDDSTAVIDVTNFTITNNSSGFNSGDIGARDANITLRNSTLISNQGVLNHGINGTNLSVSLYNSTVGTFDNTDQVAGITITTGVLNLVNTIIAGSTGGEDCSVNAGSINTDSATIVADGSCNTQRAIDPQLGPLADNGGTTLTMALKPNSPARNTGILATCETRDQRNQLRDDGDGACDVGAIEFNQNDNFGEVESFFIIPLKDKKAVIVPL